MFSVLFHIGDTPVVTYALFHVVGAVVAVVVTTLVARHLGLPVRRTLAVAAVTVIGVWVGARIGHAALNRQLYRDDPSRLLALRFGGFALYGGIVGGALAALAATAVARLPRWRAADAAAVGAGAGLVCLRFGCFGQGCCFGLPTEVPWAVNFGEASPAWAAEAARNPVDLVLGLPVESPSVHPTQLYELAAALGVIALTLWLIRRRGTPGVPALAALAAFTAFRSFNWTLRAPASTLEAPGWFWFVTYGLIVIVALGTLAWRLWTEPPVSRTAHRLSAA